jgi:tRNA/rRNA methyltransferase
LKSKVRQKKWSVKVPFRGIITDMKGKVNLDAISVVLVRPKFPENIGSVARAMKNMGLSRLIIVEGVSPLQVQAYKLASGAEEILERADEFSSLREAIDGMGCVVGMTSRHGRRRNPLLAPESLVRILLPLSLKNSMGLVFGSEKDGLTNDELSLCHLYARIPAVDSFPSLNLAHAVMVMGYELFKATGPLPAHPGQVAAARELENMFEHLEKTLSGIGFFNTNHPRKIMGALRRIFGRSKMDEREVRILQGIWSRMDWFIRERERGK